MTRRITLTFFALITALLVLAVVPLGVTKADNQEASFRFDTNSAARIVASDAEEHLSDHHSTAELTDGLAAAASSGDCAAVYDVNGSLFAQTPCTRASGEQARALADRVYAGERGSDPDQDLTAQDGQWLLVGVPVGDDGKITGMVVYARNGDPMDDRIDAMWGWLALTGIGVLAVAGLLSVRLARWVSRPLAVLGNAASRLGEGELEVRASVADGPEQVRRLAETFNWMAERIETLVHGHRSWIADVSHQLRTPLTALRLRLDLLGPDVADERAAAELVGAQEEIARLSRLVDGLLAVARAESALPAKNPVRADLIAAERVAAWEPVAAERGVALTLRADGPVTIPLGDGDLEQILDNLVANAIEAVGSASASAEPSPDAAAGNAPGNGPYDSGRVLIEVSDSPSPPSIPSHQPSPEPLPSSRGPLTSPSALPTPTPSRALLRPRASIRVIDDGPGMTAERKAAAFHRYGHPEPRGNGLGLAIVHRLTAANGGRAELRDTPGGGLTVDLEWPLHAS
jgi:signal transduction histidine kinase